MYAQTKIAELTLYDPSGNSPTLTRGVVNYDVSPKTITFTLSDSAFTQDQFYYEVKENLLSNKAVIARSTIDVCELSDFKDYQDYLNLVCEVLILKVNLSFLIQEVFLAEVRLVFQLRYIQKSVLWTKIYLKAGNILKLIMS